MGKDEQIGLMVGVRERLDARMSEWLKSPAIKAALHQVEQTTTEPCRLDDMRANVGPGDVVISPADERISPMTGLPSLSPNK